MRGLFQKLLNKEMLLYLFFGIVSTVVNYAVFTLMLSLWGVGASLWANFVAFLAAVTVAFITNKLFVFKSTDWTRFVLKKELPSFLGARVLSFMFEEVSLWLCLDMLHLDSAFFLGINCILYAKIVLSVMVIILNYLSSKFYVFRQK